jgi:hypothetical protein
MTGLLVTNARVVGAESTLEAGWVATSGSVIEALGGGGGGGGRAPGPPSLQGCRSDE